MRNEYIQYAQDVEQALSQLESRLHNSDDPQEIIMDMLVAATEFYDGDWAGIMEVDLTMKIWSTLFWYNRKRKGKETKTSWNQNRARPLFREICSHGSADMW